jgi:outer membrane protein TolC
MFVASIPAADSITVKGVTYSTENDTTTVFIEISSLGKVIHFKQDDQQRIIVNLKNAIITDDVEKQVDTTDPNGLVKDITAVQHEANIVRVIVNLEDTDSVYRTTLWRRPLRYAIIVEKQQADVQTAAMPIEVPREEGTTVNDPFVKVAASGPQEVVIRQPNEDLPAKETAVTRDMPEEKESLQDRESSDLTVVSISDQPEHSIARISSPTACEKSEVPDTVPSTEYVPMDFTQYVDKVMEANPSVKISGHDFKKTQLQFLRDLQAYGFQVGLNGYASVSHEKSGTGATIRLDVSKTLYDGGKQQILEKEFEVVKALARANLLEQYDTVILTSALYYSEFYYKQEVLDFLREQFRQRKIFIEQMEKSYQGGLKFSSYDFLTSQSDYLALEKAVVDQKADFTKTEIAFRQFGHVYNDGEIRLAPLDVMLTPDSDMRKLQKFALVHNKSIHAARLKGDLQEYKIDERKAEGGLKIDAIGSLGLEGGSTEYAGSKSGIAGAMLNFSLPLYDSGVRKTEILTEQIEYLKQRLVLQKAEEDIIKELNDIYLEYKTFGSSLGILQEQLLLNEKRLKISLERLEKGLDDYRAVRESWDDLINTKMEFIRQKTLEQKLLIDLLILSGMNLFH